MQPCRLGVDELCGRKLFCSDITLGVIQISLRSQPKLTVTYQRFNLLQHKSVNSWLFPSLLSSCRLPAVRISDFPNMTDDINQTLRMQPEQQLARQLTEFSI